MLEVGQIIHGLRSLSKLMVAADFEGHDVFNFVSHYLLALNVFSWYYRDI